MNIHRPNSATPNGPETSDFRGLISHTPTKVSWNHRTNIARKCIRRQLSPTGDYSHLISPAPRYSLEFTARFFQKLPPVGLLRLSLFVQQEGRLETEDHVASGWLHIFRDTE